MEAIKSKRTEEKGREGEHVASIRDIVGRRATSAEVKLRKARQNCGSRRTVNLPVGVCENLKCEKAYGV